MEVLKMHFRNRFNKNVSLVCETIKKELKVNNLVTNIIYDRTL